jgi:hypothetical protein
VNTPDASDVYRIQKRMKEAARKMQLMASEVGMARTVERFDKDRRKDLLARFVVTRLRAGDSAAAAEQYARADENYQAQLKGLSDVLEMAHTTLTLYDVEKCAWETCRSLLSMQRQMLQTLPGTED